MMTQTVAPADSKVKSPTYEHRFPRHSVILSKSPQLPGIGPFDVPLRFINSGLASALRYGCHMKVFRHLLALVAVGTTSPGMKTFGTTNDAQRTGSLNNSQAVTAITQTCQTRHRKTRYDVLSK
jgi:hypothetical protein